jgi:hypothetical protein
VYQQNVFIIGIGRSLESRPQSWNMSFMKENVGSNHIFWWPTLNRHSFVRRIILSRVFHGFGPDRLYKTKQDPARGSTDAMIHPKQDVSGSWLPVVDYRGE